MTPFEQTLDQLLKVDIWVLVKIIVLIFMGIYTAFAIVVMRQVNLMTSVLNGNLNLPLKAIALIHLALAVMMFLLALTIL